MGCRLDLDIVLFSFSCRFFLFLTRPLLPFSLFSARAVLLLSLFHHQFTRLCGAQFQSVAALLSSLLFLSGLAPLLLFSSQRATLQDGRVFFWFCSFINLFSLSHSIYFHAIFSFSFCHHLPLLLPLILHHHRLFVSSPGNSTVPPPLVNKTTLPPNDRILASCVCLPSPLSIG